MGQGFGVAVGYGVGHRRGLDPALLWLWHKLAAVAQIQPLAWKPPYATSTALKIKRKKKKEGRKEERWVCSFRSLVLSSSTLG